MLLTLVCNGISLFNPARLHRMVAFFQNIVNGGRLRCATVVHQRAQIVDARRNTRMVIPLDQLVIIAAGIINKVWDTLRKGRAHVAHPSAEIDRGAVCSTYDSSS